MSYRLAIGSSDGVFIDEHFATALQFLIYEIEGENYEFIEKRNNKVLCQCVEYHNNKFSSLIEKIYDCRAILIGKIGPGAQAALKEQGIDSFSVTEYIEVAIEKLIKYYDNVANFNRLA
ncbi:hydrogenase [Clostridium sp. 19966]|uniref:NifB/NifX family molybdenum-iron cluster-binding protein n=1 Tax=Clostridium sp. 19966 TaxID=2768166 RepID=UPI0028DF462C|nr:NifB/NifX family molybdenum-iron cluster-binding protein [Clostridium sp. 19966]MDT8718159.1 hydrogenase [Clostridium sp. 19966]